ncbi:MAG: hypothetical protein WCR69_00755 [Sulfuricurvum sp.]
MRRGYLLLEALIAIAIAGAVAVIFTTMGYYVYIQSNMLKEQNTKMILDVVRSRLLDLAKDVDNDSYFELLKPQNGDEVPLKIGIVNDAWGNKIYYKAVDLGEINDQNSSYVDTNESISPNPNVVARLISGGANMKIDTNVTDATAKDDDIMLEIALGELNHYKLYGGSEISSETRGYNSAIVSQNPPTTPLEGTLWFDSNASKLKIYTNSAWIEQP